MQIDNLAEIEKGKRPPEDMIWDGSSDELEDWIERVVLGNTKPTLDFVIREDEID